MELNKIYNLDCLDLMRQMPDGFVDCIVTSPPYFGLRDYGVDGQIGLEDTPAKFVAKMVEVFTEACRVLKPEGTLWLNLGDSYASNWPCNRRNIVGSGSLENGKRENRPPRIEEGLKDKDLIGIPWRVAFALQESGWWLRQDIIWAKPNPMPESVRDRCTKSHEYIFLLTKSAKYYFDADAIAEPVAESTSVKLSSGSEKALTFGGLKAREGQINGGDPRNGGRSDRNSQWGKVWKPTNRDRSLPRNRNGITGSLDTYTGYTRNKRSVWNVATQPFKEAHFATFPEKLIQPCILAGCPSGGIVYDPFSGAGTTALVAHKLGRRWIGSELNPEYVELANNRLEPYLAQETLF